MRTYVATALNFFLPGAGYLVLGVRRVLSVMWIVALLGLTYVEFGIQEPQPELYKIMFASVLLMNAAFAIDAYQEGRRQEAA